jgi:hypothetical protein
MSPAMRIFIIAVLLAHGLVHASLSWVPLPAANGPHTPFWPTWWRDAVDPTWPVNRLGVAAPVARTLGWILWLATLLGFAAAGLGLLGLPGLKAIWQSTAAVSAVISLLMLALYWHPWLVIGVLLDLAVLGALVWPRWPGLNLAAP